MENLGACAGKGEPGSPAPGVPGDSGGVRPRARPHPEVFYRARQARCEDAASPSPFPCAAGPFHSDSGPGNGDWLRSVAQVPVPFARPTPGRATGTGSGAQRRCLSPLPGPSCPGKPACSEWRKCVRVPPGSCPTFPSQWRFRPLWPHSPKRNPLVGQNLGRSNQRGFAHGLPLPPREEGRRPRRNPRFRGDEPGRIGPGAPAAPLRRRPWP